MTFPFPDILINIWCSLVLTEYWLGPSLTVSVVGGLPMLE